MGQAGKGISATLDFRWAIERVRAPGHISEKKTLQQRFTTWSGQTLWQNVPMVVVSDEKVEDLLGD